jgi:O-antigen/teichoic acid export membrane protein
MSFAGIQELKVLICKVRGNKVDSIHSRFMKAASLSLFASVVSRVITMGVMIPISRHLGAEGMGTAGLLQSTLATASSFIGLGLSAAMVKLVAEKSVAQTAELSQMIGATAMVILATTVVFALLLVLFPHQASQLLCGRQDCYEGLLWSWSGFLFMPLFEFVMAINSGFHRFKLGSWVVIFSSFITNGACLVGAWNWGVNGYLFGWTSTYSLQILAVLIFSRDAFQVKICWPTRALFKELGHYAGPALGNNLLVMGTLWFMNLVLVHQSLSTRDMGYLNLALQWRNAILFIPMGLSGVLLPILAKSIGEGTGSGSLLRFNLLGMVGFGFLAACGLGLGSTLLLSAYGPDFLPGRTTFLLLIFSSVPMISSNILGQALIASGKTWEGVVNNILWACIAIGLGLYLTPRLGAVGIGIAYLVSHPIQSLGLGLILMRKKPANKRNIQCNQ